MKLTHGAPAKVNLWLRVFQSDATGYHPLDTLFCAIDLADHIELKTSKPGIHLTVHGADVGPNESNLAYRAALEFHNALGITPAVEITLYKQIPAGAGLGGGSSDAAAVLRALQELHDQRLPEPDLMALAARLGSDVPFFLCGSPLAQATGRGELLTALPGLPERGIVVAMPDFAISTRDAYGWLDESGRLTEPQAPIERPHGWVDVERNAVNDFEAVLFQRFTNLRTLRDALQESGARVALVSGSGSALFGIFESAGQAEQARDQLAHRFGDVEFHAARTLNSRTD